jgi:hypothetical protein
MAMKGVQKQEEKAADSTGSGKLLRASACSLEGGPALSVCLLVDIFCFDIAALLLDLQKA